MTTTALCEFLYRHKPLSRGHKDVHPEFLVYCQLCASALLGAFLYVTYLSFWLYKVSSRPCLHFTEGKTEFPEGR